MWKVIIETRIASVYIPDNLEGKAGDMLEFVYGLNEQDRLQWDIVDSKIVEYGENS